MEKGELKTFLFLTPILLVIVLTLSFAPQTPENTFESKSYKTLNFSIFSHEQLSKMVFKVNESNITFDPWLNGFPYRRPITINNTQNSNTLTDYQVKIILDTASLISSIFELPITINNTQNSNTLTDYQVKINITNSTILSHIARDDCGDIRFFNHSVSNPYSETDGKLNYWIESCNKSSSLVVWIKVPNIPASSTKTIYMYYGNPDATSESNGDAVFVFFDDFEGDSLNTSKWNEVVSTGTISVSNSELFISHTSSDSKSTGIYTKNNFPVGYGISMRVKYKDESDILEGDTYCTLSQNNDYSESTDFSERGSGLKVYDGLKENYQTSFNDGSNSEKFITNIEKDGNYHLFDLIIFSNLTMETITEDDGNVYKPSSVGSLPASSFYIALGTRRVVDLGENSEMYVDYVMLRRYTSPEPTISVGLENVKESFGKMRSDCGDIRFTDSDGITQLSYWIESGCNTPETVIWVKVPEIPAKSKKTIYMYYGNPDATSESNGDAVFVFFDDFEGDSLNTSKWDTTGGVGSITVSDSKACFGPHEYALHSMSLLDSKVIYWIDWGSSNKKINLGWIVKSNPDPAYGVFASCSAPDFKDCLTREYDGSHDVRSNAIAVENGKLTLYFLENTAWTCQKECTKSIKRQYTVPNSVGISGWGSLDTDICFDKVLVAKYTNPEPTISIGEEDVLITQAGSSTDWQWKIPSSGEKVRSGTATDWSWVTFGLKHRLPITINNTQNSNTLTDYQVKINITNSTILSHIARDDCGDIRFFNHSVSNPYSETDGKLNYWIESCNKSSSLVVWIKVPNIPASSTKTIYMYYGNPDATSESNGDAVFVFFDDFESGNFDKWTSHGSWQVVTDVVKQGSKAAYCAGNAADRKLRKNITIDYNIMIHLWARAASATSGWAGYPVMSQDDEGKSVYSQVFYSGKIKYYQGDYYDWPQNSDYSANVWYKLENAIDFSNGKQKGWKNGLYMGEIDLKDSDSGTVNYLTALNVFSGCLSGTDMWIDVYYVTKYTNPEPSVSIGTEEQYPEAIVVPKGSPTSWQWGPQ